MTKKSKLLYGGKYKIKEQIEKYYTKHPDEFGNEREQNLLWLNRNKINKYDELPV